MVERCGKRGEKLSANLTRLIRRATKMSPILTLILTLAQWTGPVTVQALVRNFFARKLCKLWELGEEGFDLKIEISHFRSFYFPIQHSKVNEMKENGKFNIHGHVPLSLVVGPVELKPHPALLFKSLFPYPLNMGIIERKLGSRSRVVK